MNIDEIRARAEQLTKLRKESKVTPDDLAEDVAADVLALLDANAALEAELHDEKWQHSQVARGYGTLVETHKNEILRAQAAEAEVVALRAALEQVRDWVRDGVGSESDAAEAMDAALAREEQP